MHQMAMVNLTAALNKQLPDTLVATADTEIAVESSFPPTVRAPDVLVMSRSLYMRNPPRIDAGEVLLTVEIVSPGTGRRDRLVKAAEYAGAGIPYYWVIDLTTPASLMTLTLAGREYEISEKVTGPITLAEPATITVDVSRLADPAYLS
jgi:Uma2 family endonuclease